MQLRILHRTAYRYDEPVKYSAQALRLTPRREGRQRVLAWSMQAPGRRIEQVDAHGNVTHLLTVEDPHKEIEIVVSGVDRGGAARASCCRTKGRCRRSPISLATPLTARRRRDRRAFARVSERQRAAARPALRPCGRRAATREYQKGATGVEDAASAALARGEGVCQDQAHVFISCCRAAGIPARYVSGYLYSGNGDSGGTAASHAWVDAWIPESKAWLGIDVTHREPTGLTSLPAGRGPRLSGRRARARCPSRRRP